MLEIMRRYAYQFVNAHDLEAGRELMRDDYVLHVGPDTLVGRDEAYLPAVAGQFEQFPGLTYTIHDLLSDGTWTAVLFSEHGRSAREPGNAASWLNLGIYRADGDRLAECWVEQDFYGRRAQLDSGVPDSLQPVAVDPWDGHDAVPSLPADAVVGAWAAQLRSWPPTGIRLDPGQASEEQPRIEVGDVVVNVCVTEGSRAAFIIELRGIYRGSFGFEERIGSPVRLWAGIIAEVGDGTVRVGIGVSNRSALFRQLRD